MFVGWQEVLVGFPAVATVLPISNVLNELPELAASFLASGANYITQDSFAFPTKG